MIYIIHCGLLEDDRLFNELTDEEVVKLCEKDKEGLHHDVYETANELAGNWNTDEIFSPFHSYMRVID